MHLGGVDYRAFLASIQGVVRDYPAAPWSLPPDAFVLRHDIDDRLDRAVRMAELDAAAGIRSTFCMLDTEPYFWTGFDEMRYIQSLGHEIAWHNNAISAAIRDVGLANARDGASLDGAIRRAIERPLAALRANGLRVRGTATHGDALCGELGYINYQAWDCFPKLNTLSYSPLSLADFGLEYESYGFAGYRLTDSGGRFGLADFELAAGPPPPPTTRLICRDGLVPVEPMAFVEQWSSGHDKPLFILIHCQWWD